MPKFTVCIDYTATHIYEVEAENADLAEQEGLRQAREVVPYDELCLTVGYVDEMEEEITPEIQEVPVKITHFEYLNKLRDSGITNMYGAAPYLMREFNLPVHEARDIVTEWMTEGQHHEQ